MEWETADQEYIHDCLCEFDEMAQKKDDRFLQTALFIEEMFDITLTDEEICVENLGDKKALSAFVLKKTGL